MVSFTIRFITSAIGSSELIGPIEVSSILTEVERRRDRRLLRAVFRALLASYREQSFRALIRPFVRHHVNELPPDMLSFSEQTGILEGDGHLQKLGENLSHSRDVKSYCLSKGLNANILASNYGTELKLAAIHEAVKSLDVKSLQQLLNWVFAGIGGTPIGDYYEAMLCPFESDAPSLDVQKVLMSTLVTQFGDPRLGDWPGLRGNNGESRRYACVATIKRWLSIEYLDLFIRIIERTAEDRQFRPRK